ncbi:MAG: hypothetical protein WCO33_01590 [bacterium]
MFVVKRDHHNPILAPNSRNYWEAFATFNMSVVKTGKTTHGLYRAISSSDPLRKPDQVSIIGYAKSKDGVHFEERTPFITPKEDWEKYGCEDPRVTFFEGTYYTFYTALSQYPFNADGIKVAVALSKDFEKVTKRYLVTPFNAKAMVLFPERIGGKVTALVTVHTDRPPVKICIVQADSIDEFWSLRFWKRWYAELDKHVINLKRNIFDHIEVGAVPVKTSKGWLFIYSHIQNYHPTPQNFDKVFGIEAVLLGLEDPFKIIGRTKGAILFPEEPYELAGYIPNIVFPSGALIDEDELSIYYGAADTSVCIAKLRVHDLINSISPETREDYYFKRFNGNPIITPNMNHSWESKATFNPAAINIKGTTHILYRAMSEDNTSVIGYATSKDGLTISERLPDPIYVPREDFEMKKIAGGNSGCEDPRIIKIKDTLYMYYTAFDTLGPPRVAVTSISEKDFLARKFNWKKPILITPKGVDDKDTCILPVSFGGKYMILHRIGNDICGDYVKSLDFEGQRIDRSIRILGPRIGGWDSAKVGITAPPIKTEKGWLLLYHGVSKNHKTYRVGAVLLDLHDPTIVLSRSTDPIFEPEEEYEKNGIVNNVVFPCGATVRGNEIYIYYGGGDKVTGVATMNMDIIVKSLMHGIEK